MYYQKYYYRFYISKNVLILFGYFFQAACLYKHFCKNHNFWKIGMVKNMKFPSIPTHLHCPPSFPFGDFVFTTCVIGAKIFKRRDLNLLVLRGPHCDLSLYHPLGDTHPAPTPVLPQWLQNWFSLSPFLPDLLTSVAEGKLSGLNHVLWALAGSARLLQHTPSYSFSGFHTQSPLAHSYSLHRLSNSHFKRQQDKGSCNSHDSFLTAAPWQVCWDQFTWAVSAFCPTSCLQSPLQLPQLPVGTALVCLGGSEVLSRASACTSASMQFPNWSHKESCWNAESLAFPRGYSDLAGLKLEHWDLHGRKPRVIVSQQTTVLDCSLWAFRPYPINVLFSHLPHVKTQTVQMKLQFLHFISLI